MKSGTIYFLSFNFCPIDDLTKKCSDKKHIRVRKDQTLLAYKSYGVGAEGAGGVVVA